MEKTYVITYDNGDVWVGNFNSYSEALNYAKSLNRRCGFKIDEYGFENEINCIDI